MSAMTPAFWVRTASVLMFLTIALGAFGAHALKGRLDEAARAIFETAVRYQAYHALGLFAVAWVSSRHPSKAVEAAGWCFLAGIFWFSGSLYALSLTGIRKFGALTPIGGLLFLAGWLSLALAPHR